MFGCEITLATDNGPVQAVGCIFNDGSIYIHEPICDMWASIPDMQKELKPSGFRVVGPVIPVEDVRASIEENNKRVMAMLRQQMYAHKEDCKAALAGMSRFDHYNTPISFMSKTDEPEKVA